MLPLAHGAPRRWRTDGLAGAIWLAMVVSGAVALAGCQTVGTAIDSVFQPDLRQEMTDEDVATAVASMQEALEDAANGSARSWSNPASGNRGSITPERTYQTDEGLFCREFTEAITVGGRTEEYDATACRGDDGIWRLDEI